MPIQAAPLSTTIRKITVSLNALQFQGALHGVVVDQNDPLVSVCTQGHEPTKIQFRGSCPACGNRDSATWSRAHKVGSALAVVDQEELAQLQTADDQFKGKIQLSVVEVGNTDLVPSGSSYYLAPLGSGGENYALIAALVKKHPKVAFIGEFSFRGAPHLFRLEVGDGGVLVLREIARPEALRERPQVVTTKVDSAALALGEKLIELLTEPFKAERWVNGHAAKVTELVAKTPAAASGSAPVAGGDLLAQLEAGVAAATASKTPPAKKRAARKAAAAEATTLKSVA